MSAVAVTSACRLPAEIFSLQATWVKLPQVPLYTTNWVLAIAPAPLAVEVVMVTALVVGTNVNHTLWLSVAGPQQMGATGSDACVVAPTLVKTAGVHVAEVFTVSGMALAQLSLVGWATAAVKPARNHTPRHNQKYISSGIFRALYLDDFLAAGLAGALDLAAFALGAWFCIGEPVVLAFFSMSALLGRGGWGTSMFPIASAGLSSFT